MISKEVNARALSRLPGPPAEKRISREGTAWRGGCEDLIYRERNVPSETEQMAQGGGRVEGTSGANAASGGRVVQARR